MKRIFAAFPIYDELSDAFLRIAEINSGLEGIRWTKKDNLHITLFFIGEVEEKNIETIILRFKEVAVEFKPFELEFENIEIRSTKRKPSMIWAKFNKSDEYSSLSVSIHNAISDFMTIVPSHKDPIPHCTLARIKSNADVGKLDLSFSWQQEVLISHVELWMTVQTKDGVVYERLLKNKV